MIRAVTFDLWDTVIHDDSDEAKRATQGLKSKKETRRHLLWEALQNEAPITPEAVWLACDMTDAAFNHVWHDQFVTWTVPERLGIVLTGLGRTLPDPVLENVIQQYEEMEVMVAPDMMPFRNVTGLLYDSGDYPASLALALERGKYGEFEARRAAARRASGSAAASCTAFSTAALSMSEAARSVTGSRMKVPICSSSRARQWAATLLPGCSTGCWRRERPPRTMPRWRPRDLVITSAMTLVSPWRRTPSTIASSETSPSSSR